MSTDTKAKLNQMQTETKSKMNFVQSIIMTESNKKFKTQEKQVEQMRE